MGNDSSREPSPRADVCVIGSGPAGALTSYRLAKAGYDVVVLEAGPRFDFDDRLEQMEQTIRPSHEFFDVWDMGGPRDEFRSTGSVKYPLNARRVKGVGGSSLAWGGRLGRLHEKDFEMNTRYGLAADWPISYDDIQPYYAEAEREIGASGPEDKPFSPPREHPPPMDAFAPSYSDSLFADACEKLDITMHRTLFAINSEPYDGRNMCQGYGTCFPVCPSGARYSADFHVSKAESNGARVIDRVPVQRLEHDADGETVTAAVYVTPDGTEYRQKARRFVLAAGGVETPRLLLLSKSEQYPDGLANTSGAVGRYFMERPVCNVVARIDRRTRQHLIGFGTSESHQFYDYESPPPGSIKIEFKNIRGPRPIDLALNQQTLTDDMKNAVQNPTDVSAWSDFAREVFTGAEWGDDLLASMREKFGGYIGVSASVEGLPKKENRVTLSKSETDEYGNPAPEISWTPSSFAKETMDHAFEILEKIVRNLDANVLDITRSRHWKGIGHHIGTTRMGSDPASSVVDRNLRTHDLENLYIASSSVFVTSGAMQPTLTIAALAIRLAEHLDQTL